VKKLEENRDIGIALEPEQEKTILDEASRSRSRLIYPFLVTLAWSGMRSDEARTLHWSQVDFEAGEVRVGKAKTEAGTGRRIPMSAELRSALERHLAWCASKLGPVQPDWFVFPLSNRIKPVDSHAACNVPEEGMGERATEGGCELPATRLPPFLLHQVGRSRGAGSDHVGYDGSREYGHVAALFPYPRASAARGYCGH
jgi:Phage integrase family